MNNFFQLSPVRGQSRLQLRWGTGWNSAKAMRMSAQLSVGTAPEHAIHTVMSLRLSESVNNLHNFMWQSWI